jgi:MoxR-like ATPase
MFNITIGYPNRDEELDIVRNTTSNYQAKLKKILRAEEILEIQKMVRSVPIANPVIEYAVDLVRNTRPEDSTLPFIQKWVTWGAGPRASQYLVIGAKARAILHGRTFASREDINAVALPILRHRILTSFQAEADGITTDQIIGDLINTLGDSKN